jgi:hypothetical protein
MKKLEKLFISALLAVAAILPATADVHHDNTTKVTHFDYSNYTYSYIEDGVEKTAHITDEATSPDQIIGLLKKVYTDPTIPGIHYAYDYNGTQRKKLNYNFNASLGTPWAKDGDISNPNEDGMTMLVVQVKDGYKVSMASGTDRNKINVAFQSVKLVNNFTRVNDPENPGYLMSIDGISTNRFFFLSKGKPRASHTAPLYMTYEQISPVNHASGSATTNFISEIKAGHSYPCIHDCGNVITLQQGHWFTIDNSGENYSLNNLTIFMPDRRFEDNLNPNTNASDNEATNGEVYKNYGRGKEDDGPFNEVIAPKVLMYTADLNAEATPSNIVAGDDKTYYDVKLDWGTSFTKEKLGVDVPQHFYLYGVADDGTRTLIQDVRKDDNGMVIVNNHSYSVEQTEDPQTFRYVITAHAINYDTDGNVLRNEDGTPYITINAESPVRTVTIPGKHYAFFTEVSEYRSRYHVESANKQMNIYKNTISISPASANDYENIRPEAYKVYRKYGRTDKLTDKPIATVTFIPKFDDDGRKQYDYMVEYDNSTQDMGFLFDEEVPVTSGKLTSYDNSTVKVIDRFTESTTSNNHYDKYTYTFKELKTNGYYACSHQFEVPVYKTTNDVGGEGRTLDEVVADVNHNAKATPDNTITFSAINNPAANLVNYEIRRLSSNNFKNYTKVGKAENFNNSGQYFIYALNSAGQLNELVGTETVSADGGNITTHDINSSSTNQVSAYVPVINTLYNGDASKPNSYGCDIQRMRYPQVQLAVLNTTKTEPFYGNDGDLMGYQVYLQIKPVMPTGDSNIDYVYYYRLWREIDGSVSPTRFDEEKLLNYEDKQSGEGWSNDYDCLYTTYPGEESVSVNDIFVDCAYEGTKKVNYIVRLYATTIPGEAGYIDHAPRAVSEGGNGKDYFIAEAKISVTFDNDTPTAIGTIDAESQVENVTYYNMMGVASSRPHQGINIVVKRMSDGSTSTSKLIY